MAGILGCYVKYTHSFVCSDSEDTDTDTEQQCIFTYMYIHSIVQNENTIDKIIFQQ